MSGEYLGDYAGTETVEVVFETFDSNGASVTLAGSPSFAVDDIRVYKGTSMTERTSNSGYALMDIDGVDLDGIIGLHGFTIDLSDDTDSGFFASGNDYRVVVTGLTVDSQIVSFVAARFSIQNRNLQTALSRLPAALVDGKMDSYVDGLTVGAGGISTVATGATVTTGSETLTYTSTEALDGTTHDVEDAAGSTEFYYEFSVGVAGIATEVRWDGYAQSNGDSYTIKAYDWVSASWKTIGDISGTNATSIIERTFVVTRNMTGTGANAGIVRWQVTSSDGTKFATDRIVVEYTASVEAGIILHSGVAQAGSSNTITLDSGANSNDDFYNHAKVIISSGTGSEQERIIVDYNGATKVATIAPPWVTQPDSTSAFEVEPGNCHAETGWGTIKVGLIQAATSTTATLDSTASSMDDYYNNELLHIDAGTGEGQVRVITDYDGTTKVATVHAAWTTTPDTTSEYIVEEAHPYIDAQVSSVSAPTAAAVADAVWDETLSGAEHNVANSAGRRLRQSQEYQGYEGGAVWIDTVSGSAGTTVYDYGTVEVPSDNIADATTIASTLGYHRFRIAPGATFTLTQTYNNYFFEGDGYTLALGGQDVTNCKFSRASSAITGIYSGTFPFFYECSIGTVSGTPAAFQTCGFSSTFTVTATGNYYLVDCFSQIAGGTAPVFDFGGAVAGTNMSIRRWSGGITINNLAAGDVVSLEGTFGTITLNGADATVEIRGICKNLVNNLTGSPTVNDDCVSADDIQDILTDTGATIPALITTLNDVSVSDILTTQMTEAYAADGTAPTLAQAIFLIQQMLGDFAISGTTITVKQLDGSTTAATFTLDDSTSPTSKTRAT